MLESVESVESVASVALFMSPQAGMATIETTPATTTGKWARTNRIPGLYLAREQLAPANQMRVRCVDGEVPATHRRRFLVQATAALAAAGSLGHSRAGFAARRAQIPYAETQVKNRELLAQMYKAHAPLLDFREIVIHHTAADYATLKGIDRYHRNHFGDPLGAEYHFVINNGKKGPLGLIEAARWRYQELAAHLFHPERAPAAVAICLIGNFEKRTVPGEMIDALRELTRSLMTHFSIPAERVTTHREVDGRLTQCPGKHFDAEKFRASLIERAQNNEPHSFWCADAGP